MGFPAQTDGDCSIETADGIDDMRIKLDTLILRVTQFPVGGEFGEILNLQCSFCFNRICLSGQTRMAGDETQHSDGNIFRLGGFEYFLNHFGVGILPAVMNYARVNSETNTIAMILTSSSGVDSLIEVCGIKLILIDCQGAINTPENHCPVVGFYGNEVVNIAALGKQHKAGIRQTGKEINKHRRKICNVVEGEGVEHFAHIEADFAQRAVSEFGDLPEHCVVVDVDFYKLVVFAIDHREIAIRAAIRAAIGSRDKFVIRTTTKAGAEFAIEFVNKRRRITNHKGSLAFNKRPSKGAARGRGITLLTYVFNLRGRENFNNSLCLTAISDFSPKQYRIRFELFGSIHKHYYFNQIRRKENEKKRSRRQRTEDE